MVFYNGLSYSIDTNRSVINRTHFEHSKIVDFDNEEHDPNFLSCKIIILNMLSEVTISLKYADFIRLGHC